MIFGDDDLIVNLSYPIEISINDEPPRTQYLSFNIRQNIRLKKIHEAALRMKREIRAISSALDYLVRNRLGNDMLEDNVAGKQILNIKPFMKSQSDD